jgi:hypothetical protein
MAPMTMASRPVWDILRGILLERDKFWCDDTMKTFGNNLHDPCSSSGKGVLDMIPLFVFVVVRQLRPSLFLPIALAAKATPEARRQRQASDKSNCCSIVRSSW